MTNLTPTTRAEREVAKKMLGMGCQLASKSAETLILSLIGDVERLVADRDAWRAATGLSSMTPEQAGAEIDRRDDSLAEARRVVEGLVGALTKLRRWDFPENEQLLWDEIQAALARAAEWQKGKQ